MQPCDTAIRPRIVLLETIDVFDLDLPYDLHYFVTYWNESLRTQLLPQLLNVPRHRLVPSNSAPSLPTVPV